jgi:dolichol-phosphate mannosyltransferase
VTIIQLTRNFGQPNAIAAGLDYATGDLIILMDSDLQDRPEDVAVLLDALERHQAPMAIATCAARGDDPFKIAASRWFNSLANRITNVQYEPKSRVFRVMTRELADKLKEVSEKTATPLSLLSWMGSDYVTVELNRDPRYAGRSGYSLRRMLELSLDRIFSHSLLPIRLSSLFGVFLGIASILLAVYFIIQKLFLKSVLPGWTSIVVIVLFLLGMNFIFIGILGEYMGRIYMEVKNRPRYVIKTVFPGTTQTR